MEKVLSQMPNQADVKAERILEINKDHKIFEILNGLKDNDDKLKAYANMLYYQALLIEGINIEDLKSILMMSLN